MPKVTVLLPVYNGQRYIRDAIKSILTQSFQDFELLIVDDGSSDSSVAIIKQFQDPRIRLLCNPQRLKLSGALNRGLNYARGEYVARMDADDLCLPHRLEKQVAFLDRNPHVGMCGSWIAMFGLRHQKVFKQPAEHAAIQAKALFDNPFVHPSVFLRTRFFEDHGLRYNGWYYPTEDFELWSRAIQLFECRNIPEVLLHYRVHAVSMTRADWTQMDLKSLLIAKRQLSAMGLTLDDEELRFHRNIGREMSYSCRRRSEIERAEQWLKRLLSSNREIRRFSQNALQQAVADVWYRLCLNSSRLGVWILKKYVASPLLERPIKFVRVAVMAASVFRRSEGAIRPWLDRSNHP